MAAAGMWALMSACTSTQAYCATYYVSNAGDDSANSGKTAADPWRTLEKINSSTFQPGDQILFRRGDTFYGSLIVKDSGTSEQPITYGAYGDGTAAKPVITGFTTVRSWTNTASNIWESDVAVSSLPNCNMLTINGVNSPMGRYPNANADNAGYLTYQTHTGHTGITSNQLSGTPDWTGAEVVMRSAAYHFMRSPVTAQHAGTLTFKPIDDDPEDGNGFFIESDIRTLDQPNEWYFNPATGKVSIFSKEQPGMVNVASVEDLVTIQASHVAFNNLALTGANGAAIYAAVHAPNYSDVTISNCDISHVGISAIYTQIDNMTIENNSIAESNGNAIEVCSGNYNTLRDNNISNIGLFAGMKNLPPKYKFGNSAIDCTYGSHWVVEYNTIRNVGFNGISCWNGDGRLIKNNFIDRFCSVLDDGAGIYTYTGRGGDRQSHDVKITGNIIVNGIGAVEGSTFRHQAVGIYLDEGSNNMEASFNSIADVACYGIFLVSAGNLNVHDNTVLNASSFQCYEAFWGFRGTSPTTTDTIRNNIFVSKYAGLNGDIDEQKCLAFYFNDPNNPTHYAKDAAKLDNNWYARPVADDKVIRNYIPAPASSSFTLAEWQAYSGQDANSHGSPIAITDPSFIRFEYNASKVAKTIVLKAPMIDVKGVQYESSITLQPFTSAVLINNPIVAFSAPTYSVDRNATTATITAARTGSSIGAVSVQYEISNSIEAAPSSALATTGTLRWNDGDTANKTFTVAINKDAARNQTVKLALRKPVNATIGSQNEAVLRVTEEVGQ